MARPPRKRSCPICKTVFTASSDEPNFPFCTERCRLIDLGNWVDEQYKVPEDDDQPAYQED